ncbi:hypothetical protein DEM26_18645 [Thioclava sp. NG1]|nr:hypothetical protein B6V72_17615 [Thioclava sp. F34-6]PWE48362.1 hypothetical protein DEM26_18645 [Thioclava sp. NG1]
MRAAMERTTAAAKQLEHDTTQIACWIEIKHPGSLTALEVQRHYSCDDNAIAHVVPLVSDVEMRRMIRRDAETAFRALGYALEPEGRDVFSIFARVQNQSNHALLHAFAEIERTLLKATEP